MTWELEYLPEALTDLEALNNSIRQPVIKGIKKVRKNPVSKEDGGIACCIAEDSCYTTGETAASGTVKNI